VAAVRAVPKIVCKLTLQTRFFLAEQEGAARVHSLRGSSQEETDLRRRRVNKFPQNAYLFGFEGVKAEDAAAVRSLHGCCTPRRS
jgi:hypothetical protein